VRALHFTDIALGVDPENRAAREAKISAMRSLLNNWNGEAFDEARILELEIRRESSLLQAAIDQSN
jgi:hypothetical protein